VARILPFYRIDSIPIGLMSLFENPVAEPYSTPESFLAMEEHWKFKAIRLDPLHPNTPLQNLAQLFFDWDDPNPHPFARYLAERS
jgi:hypothetical protein